MIALISLTDVFDAPSISITSTLVPAAISRHDEHSPHGCALIPLSQLRAFARSLAELVFPTPLGPEKR